MRQQERLGLGRRRHELKRGRVAAHRLAFPPDDHIGLLRDERHAGVRLKQWPEHGLQ